MQNPLDSGEPILFEMMNPNPTSSKTKDGPKYKITVEVERHTWDCFMDAETKGMILECICQVTHRNEKQQSRCPNTVDAFEGKPDKDVVKGGPLSIRSDSLARDPEFHRYVCEKIELGTWKPNGKFGTFTVGNDEFCRIFIREYCDVSSRSLLDHDEQAAARFKDLLSDYMRWQND